MKIKQFLENYAQTICDDTYCVLEWFMEDNIDGLYTMIMENMGIDDFMQEMSHRVYELDDIYYILEEDDMLRLQEIEQGE